jgi:glyoxylase-like metal-dependent hydrolase (beta-lactamase superfamily II)/rhodanese-related sulfurtransferase
MGIAMILEEIRSVDGTGTLTYLVIDESTGTAVLIDPNLSDLSELIIKLEHSRAKLHVIIDTHTHADHISAAGELQKRFGAPVVMHENTLNKWKVVDQGDRFGIGDILRANAAIPVQRYVTHGDILRAGSIEIRILHTPGHTDNHICPLIEGHLFTGDLLLLGQAGRSDLPGGDPGQQYDSLFATVLNLPDTTMIHPGHDYEGNAPRMLGQEKTINPFLAPRTREEYIAFVADFFPPLAEMTSHGAATLQCGVTRIPAADAQFRNITPEELSSMLKNGQKPFLLDVREPFELIAFGAIPGVMNIPLGQVRQRTAELPADREIVVICQSGSRSVEAANLLTRSGFGRVFNLQGGTIRWVRSGYPVAHPSDSMNPSPRA